MICIIHVQIREKEDDKYVRVGQMIFALNSEEWNKKSLRANTYFKWIILWLKFCQKNQLKIISKEE